MAHGQPDFGMYAQKSTVFGIADMAELAARLGSPCTYDRRGDVIFIEDFSGDTGGWLLVTGSAESSKAASAERYRSRPFSCKLVVGGGVSKYTGLQKYLPVPIYSRVGLEVSFSPTIGVSHFWVSLLIFTGAQANQFAARVYRATGNIEILQSDGSYVEVGSLGTLEWEETLFHTIKLVGDYTTDEYVRVMVDDEEVDISAYDIRTYASTNSRSLRVDAYAYADDNNCFVDDIILTQNEP